MTTLAGQYPILKQILVVAVRTSTQGDGGIGAELARVSRDEHGHEAILLWQIVQMLHHTIYCTLHVAIFVLVFMY